MASILKKNKVSVSKFFRIKQKNKTWKYFHLLLIPSKTNFSEDSIRIGIQFDLTNLFSKELKDKSSFSDFEDANLKKLKNLSKREKQILQLIVEGYTDRDIAKKLNISNYTSEKHRKNIIQKLQVKNTACLSFMAGKCNFFSSPEK